MIQRIAPVLTYTLTMLRPRIEHQYRAVGRVVGEDREHAPLVIMIEVKKTIPSENAIEAPTERQLPHVGDNPFMIGKTPTAKRNHGRRRIDACHAQSQVGHVLRDGSPGATAKVQYVGALAQFGDETIMPDLIVPVAALAIAVPCVSVFLVVSDNPAGEISRHLKKVGGSL
jgi:hypothetical protein